MYILDIERLNISFFERIRLRIFKKSRLSNALDFGYSKNLVFECIWIRIFKNFVFRTYLTWNIRKIVLFNELKSEYSKFLGLRIHYNIRTKFQGHSYSFDYDFFCYVFIAPWPSYVKAQPFLCLTVNDAFPLSCNFLLVTCLFVVSRMRIGRPNPTQVCHKMPCEGWTNFGCHALSIPAHCRRIPSQSKLTHKIR